MRNSLTASVLCATLVLTGCTVTSQVSSERNVAQNTKPTYYELSNKIRINDLDYSSLKQYKQERSTAITTSISLFVKAEGYSIEGYNQEGFDRRGYNRNHVDEDGYDEDGYTLTGVNEYGTDRNGQSISFGEGFNKIGFDDEGYDTSGFDRLGFDKNGYNEDGFNAAGESNVSGDLSIEEYSKRSWANVSSVELLEHDLNYAQINKYMLKYKALRDSYYEESMHPWSESSFHINLLYNNTPSIFDDILAGIQVDTISKWSVKHQEHHDSKYILKSDNANDIIVLSDAKLLPPSLQEQWEAINSKDPNKEINVVDEDGSSETYYFSKSEKLSDTEQEYIDIARLTISKSKGKWALAQQLLFEGFLQAADEQDDELQISKSLLKDVRKVKTEGWPPDYLTESDADIESFNDEEHEAFLQLLQQHLVSYQKLYASLN